MLIRSQRKSLNIPRLLSISATNPNYNFLPEQEPVTMLCYTFYKQKGALDSTETSTVLAYSGM